MNWIIDNKEWLFSGIGVLVISLIIGYFKRNASSKKQVQKSGNNSTNIQAGKNVTVEIKDDK